MHLLLKDSIDEQMLLLGNEAIARGALEAGLAFAAAYPGTPSSEIALQFFQISRESDLYFEYSANEKVALEVASDALMTLAYTGITGSLVLLVADVPVRMSEFHGMAQRGGVVESMVLLGQGNSCCFADGDTDVLIGFEPSETIRAAKKCMAGSVLSLNMVMLGAMVQSNAVPLSADLFYKTIREKTKKAFVDVNLKAFESGMKAAGN